VLLQSFPAAMLGKLLSLGGSTALIAGFAAVALGLLLPEKE